MNDRALKGRRGFLRSALGATLALPYLPSYPGAATAAPGSIPKRSVLIFTGHNTMPMMLPTVSGAGDLDFTGGYLAAFQPWAHESLVVDWLEGTGAHGSGTSEAFSGRPSEGSEPTGGPTLDLYFAERERERGIDTRIDALSLLGAGRQGRSDAKLSWSHDGVGRPLTVRADLVMDRVFGEVAPDESEIIAQQRAQSDASILNGFMEDYRVLNAQLGRADRAQLERHLDSLRDHEAALMMPNTCGDRGAIGTAEDTETFENHPRICRAAGAALGCGATNHVMLANYGHPMGFRVNDLPGVTEADYHAINHGNTGSERGREPIVDAQEQHRIVNDFFATNVAEQILKPLSETPEEDGQSVLDHTMVFWTTELGFSNDEPHMHTRGESADHKGRGARMAVYVKPAGDYLKTNALVDVGYQHYQDLLLTLVHSMGYDDEASFGDHGNTTISEIRR